MMDIATFSLRVANISTRPAGELIPVFAYYCQEIQGQATFSANDPCLIKCSLAHFSRIFLDKPRHSMDMSTKPANTIFIHQIRKLLVQVPKICLELPRFFGRGSFSVRYTAPGTQRSPGVVDAVARIPLENRTICPMKREEMIADWNSTSETIAKS